MGIYYLGMKPMKKGFDVYLKKKWKEEGDANGVGISTTMTGHNFADFL